MDRSRGQTPARNAECLRCLSDSFAEGFRTPPHGGYHPAEVSTYVTLKQREGLKGWTIKGHLTVLGAIFKYGARHLGLVGANPVRLLDGVERPNSDDQAERRILNSEELSRLLSEVEDEYRAIFDLAAETGARLSEVLGLIWKDIDFKAQTITFTHQLGRDGTRQPLKTKRSRRCIEITPTLVARLRTVKLASEKSNDHDFVFLSRALRAHDQRNIGGRVLDRAVKKAGLEAEKLDGKIVRTAPTFHDLRHTHASALIAQGWDIAEVSARLGHSNVATTLRIYAHEFDAAGRTDHRRQRLAALYGAMEALPEASDGDGTGQGGTDHGQQIQQLRAVGTARNSWEQGSLMCEASALPLSYAPCPGDSTRPVGTSDEPVGPAPRAGTLTAERRRPGWFSDSLGWPRPCDPL